MSVLIGRSMLAFLFAAMTAPAVSQTPPAALTNRCAVCHLRAATTSSWITHADQWVTSRHAFSGVGCESCHGGDAATSESNAAHRGVKNSSDRSSTVFRTALPATCGRCHAAEARAFGRSVHRKLLSQGDAMAPTCTTCHGSMAADIPSPPELASKCGQCHREDQRDRARAAGRQLQDLAGLTRKLRRAQLEAAGVSDPVRRARLTEVRTEASRSVQAAIASIHAFDEQLVEDQLHEARVKIDRLLAEIR